MSVAARAVHVRPRAARALLLAAVFVCAACGLVYELALVALGSYLLGDAVTQASIVLSVMICAMGVGSLAAKPLQRWPVPAFAAVELTLALVGGLSVMALYASFAWLDLYRPALLVVASLIGVLIGAEIPILTTLLHRIHAQEPGHTVADLFAADYVGALVGGLAFPFLLLPRFGHLQGALLVGAVNLVAGGLVVGVLFRGSLVRRASVLVGGFAVVVAGVLGAAALRAARFEVDARQVLYDDPVVHAERSAYQEVVLTRATTGDVRLYLDGDLQFSSVDEYRYHEALVHPAMSGGRRDRVLVLGGGDGLALREVLRHDDVDEVVLVDLDPAVVDLARTDDRIRRLNEGAFEDPRVSLVHADAFRWLRGDVGSFDVVIADLPDPDAPSTAKLYSVELYGLVHRSLADGGRLVVQAGSPYFAPDAFWCIERTVAAAGFETTPYHVDVPSFGDWGFVIAASLGPDLRVDAGVARELRFLDEGVLRAATTFPPDRARRDLDPSTLLRPSILDHVRRGWGDY